MPPHIPRRSILSSPVDPKSISNVRLILSSSRHMNDTTWPQMKEPPPIYERSLRTDSEPWRQCGVYLPLGQNDRSSIELSLGRLVYSSSSNQLLLPLRSAKPTPLNV